MQTRAETHPTDLNEAVRRYQAGERGAAIELCRDLVARQPGDLRARYTLAVMLLESGRLRDGIVELDQLLNQRPDDADALHSRGMAHDRLGNSEAAIADLEKAIALAPGKVEAWLVLAGVHRRAGDIDKAIIVLRDAQKASPEHAGLTNNLASLLAETGALDESRGLLEALLARDPASTAGHYNLGNTLKAMGDAEAAVGHLRQAAELDPGFYSAWHNLGNTLLDLGRVDEAAGAYDHATGIKRRPGGPTVPANNFNQTSRTKLEHDIEQLDYLLERGVLDAAHQQTAAAYRAALSSLETPDADSHMVDLPAAAAAMLKPTYNRMIHKDAGAALDGPAVNPELDIAAIEADYKKNAPGITFFDDFLTADAVRGLRRFCLESTIWYEFRYANGYLGAFMEDGFCCPLLLQVAEEMRTALPAIFKHHSLRKLWAFKYDSRLSGIPMHADFAAVNVNFWIAPDEANLDPDGGGLEVWDVEAPLDWDFAAYNRDGPRMRNFLAENNAKSINVPHRQNRVVMFNSDLFHETGRLTFKPGYENRRINITMLYGKRGDSA
ncbi:MAG: tetratricopeptide repeat protein [Pseudomonadota bacterium]